MWYIWLNADPQTQSSYNHLHDKVVKMDMW